jgi:hypothetical protein
MYTVANELCLQRRIARSNTSSAPLILSASSHIQPDLQILSTSACYVIPAGHWSFRVLNIRFKMDLPSKISTTYNSECPDVAIAGSKGKKLVYSCFDLSI